MNNFSITMIVFVLQGITFFYTYGVYKEDKGTIGYISSKYRYAIGIVGAIVIPFLFYLMFQDKPNAGLGGFFVGNAVLLALCNQSIQPIDRVLKCLIGSVMGLYQAYPFFVVLWILFSKNKRLKKRIFIIVTIWFSLLIIMATLLQKQDWTSGTWR